ncbi:hypothetical protein FQN52_000512 [Onygenales sp. PD_12]|nr:hypothetical protein FQN52_000512 [Onygenales sp. PD_12]
MSTENPTQDTADAADAGVGEAGGVEPQPPEGAFLQFYQCETSPDGTTSETPKPLFVEKMPATPDPKTITLAELRTMVKDQRTLKSMQTAPFCTKGGSEVKDTITLGDYLAISSSDQKTAEEVPTVSAASTVYLKTTKIASAMDENFKNSLKTNFDRGLNLDTTQPNAPILTTQAPTIQSSFDMNTYMAVSGSADSIHPADMTEQQWGVVMRDSALLCGHRLTTTEVQDNDTTQTAVTAIERVEYPAFALKPRTFEPYEFGAIDPATGMASTDQQSYRIPYFQLDDDSYVKSIETSTSLQSSLATSSFSATDVQASVGGGAFGCTVAAQAGLKISNSQASATDKTDEKDKLIMTYNFPRVSVLLDSGSLDLTDNCKNDLDNVTDPQSIDAFVTKYGTFYATRIQLGGRLFCTHSKESSGTASEADRTSAFKAAASASFSSPFATGSASASYEQGGATKSLDKAADLNVSIAWEGQGGDTLLSNNPAMWCPTVSSFYNWRVVKQDQVKPLVDFIGQIPGYQDIPAKFQGILDSHPELKVDLLPPLRIGQCIPLARDLEQNNVIVISSTYVNTTAPKPGFVSSVPVKSLLPSDHTNLSFCAESTWGDTLLHISFRRADGRIIFNTCSGGSWGAEESIPLQNRFTQAPHTIFVQDQGGCYGVFIDNTQVHSFAKRDSNRKVRSVSYILDTPAVGSMLSDPLQVKVYPSMDAVRD